MFPYYTPFIRVFSLYAQGRWRRQAPPPQKKKLNQGKFAAPGEKPRSSRPPPTLPPRDGPGYRISLFVDRRNHV